jgi:undecaprenyl diphosphate synthase
MIATPPAEAAGLHVAIVMDGNGRWAQERGLPRAVGHERGVETLRRVVETASAFGVTHLTVFGFSTENWSRPPTEVEALFGLLRTYVKRDLDRLHRNGVRIRVLGRREGLGPDLIDIIDLAQSRTLHNDRLQLSVAFNYGGRGEIVHAARSLAEAVQRGELAPEAIDGAAFASRLWGAELPDPDLIIRTSGEHRVSNFLLWQCAYSEFVFTDVRWPDFQAADLGRAIDEFRGRRRRFGGV